MLNNNARVPIRAQISRGMATRSTWASEDEPCHQKLPFDMWAFMKAEGSGEDADVKHVYVECLRKPELGMIELITPKVSIIL